MGKRRNTIWWIGLVIGLMAINYIASVFHQRFDLTQDKRYSITPTTKELLKNLQGELTITVFLKGNFPSEFRKLSTATNDFLNVFREASGSKVKYRFISPDEEATSGKSWGDSLHALGAAPINLNVQVKSGEENKIVFPYALLQYHNETALVNLFQSSKRNISYEELNNAEAMMEYQFVKTIDKLVDPQKPFIAYAVGNGEPVDARTYDLQQVVGSNYKLFTFDVKAQSFIPDTMKVLLIVKPADNVYRCRKTKDRSVCYAGRESVMVCR